MSIKRIHLNIFCFASFVAMDGLDHRVPGVKEFCLNVERFYVEGLRPRGVGASQKFKGFE